MENKWFNLAEKQVVQKLDTNVEKGLTSSEITKKWT